MKLAHDSISSGHVGAAKTLAKVKDQFIWPAMSRDIKRYCASCPICQRLGKGVKVFKAPPKAPPRDQSAFPVCCRGFCRTVAQNQFRETLFAHGHVSGYQVCRGLFPGAS